MRLRRLLALLLFLPAFGLAAVLEAGDISRGGNITRDLQLREISDIVRPYVNGYIALGTYYFPLPGQTQLRTAYGVHDGYAFSQRVTAYFGGEIGKTGVSVGGLYWLERHGWDSEDFILFPDYGEFSLVRSVQTAGLSVYHNKMQTGFAGGVQFVNPEYVSRKAYVHESDSLFGWGHAFWGPFALQGSFGSEGWNMARAQLRLESKELYGGVSKGWRTYLPNLEVATYRDASDSLRFSWEQNLYKQLLYGEVTAYLPDYGFYSAALKFYPDPSRIISFEATCFRDDDGDLTWGGGVSFLFFRLAYNHSGDIERLFGTKGTFIAEVSFQLGATETQFFAKNAAKSAPMETSTKTRHEQGSGYQKPGANEPLSDFTVTGIRREKIE